MRKIITTACLFALSAYSAGAQADSAAKAAQLIKIEQSLVDALPGDSATWSKYLGPAWYIITEDGSGLNKAEFLSGFRPFQKGYSGHINVIKPVVVFHDNIAVVHYVSDEYETVLGQQLHTSYASADTWYKTPTSWMMLASQVFEIPQLPPAVKIGEDVLKSYTGTYQMADRKALITLKDDTLFIQKNNGPAEALLPETNTIFFRLKDARGRKIFINDDAGVMLMRERRNGQDLVWRRI